MRMDPSTGRHTAPPAPCGPDDALPGPESAARSMGVQVEVLAAQAERQAADGEWQLSPQDVAVARTAADGLAEAVGPAPAQQALPGIERLERLREALAALAVGVARTHGQLAWFLAQGAAALAPVLHWRALTADRERAFGTVVPGFGDLTDAENAVRRLHTALVTAALADTEPDDARPGTVA